MTPPIVAQVKDARREAYREHLARVASTLHALMARGGYLCDTCHAPATNVEENGEWASCDACEAEHNDRRVHEYPNGQCGQCGAAYELVTRNGVARLEANHIEGACSAWRDVVGEDDHDGHDGHDGHDDTEADDVGF